MKKTTRLMPLWGVLSLLVLTLCAESQPVTGVWKGRLQGTRLELKLIKKGDSLVGTSYYYESKNSYRRYSVKGYFDDATNGVVWWDEALLDSRPARKSGKEALIAIADFNCPGDGTMKLEGESAAPDNREAAKTPFMLEKSSSVLFPDEWDFVLDNYTIGANNPAVIDSVALIAEAPVPVPQGYEAAPPPSVVLATPQPLQGSTATAPSVKEPVSKEATSVQAIAGPTTSEEKFNSRTKTLQTVIPVSGDTIELRFYDNAEIDGDSIAVFLNNTLVEQHIGLTDQPHKIRIPVSRLENDNELVMVAENLGSIPPNTSLMVVQVGEKRYEARLYADEHTSALVRFVKELK